MISITRGFAHIEKRSRRTVHQLDQNADASAAKEIFDKVKEYFTKNGKRFVSVANFLDGVRILLYKADDAVIDVPEFPIEVAQLRSITS